MLRRRVGVYRRRYGVALRNEQLAKQQFEDLIPQSVTRNQNQPWI
jgi:hypothetical protein